MEETLSRTFQLTLTPTDKAELRKLAEKQSTSMREVLRFLIRQAAEVNGSDRQREDEGDA